MAARRKPKAPPPPTRFTGELALFTDDENTEHEVTLVFPIIDVYNCDGCDTVYGDGDDGLEPVYECNSCGEVFTRSNSNNGNNHQCPQCLKFGAKLSDHGCTNCNQETEMMDGVVCDECGESILVDDLANHYLDNHDDILAQMVADAT